MDNVIKVTEKDIIKNKIEFCEPALLIFEGPDKAGKTTIKTELLKLTNKFICWDRGFASQHVYGKLCEKTDSPRTDHLRMLEMGLASNKVSVFYIFVKAEVDVLQERMIKANEEEFLISSVDEALTLYENYFRGSHIVTIPVDTTELTIEESIFRIVRKIYTNQIKDCWRRVEV